MVPSERSSFLDNLRPDLAWQPYFPTSAAPWNLERVGHLYRRAGFAATHQQLQAGLDLTPGELVDLMLEGGEGLEAFEEQMERVAGPVRQTNNIGQHQALWMYRLLFSPHPLEERMTLFWHDHFATSQAKVGNVSLMQRQVDLFREHSLGYFGDLLQGIARDPAMLIWLDADSNRKGKANENLAREILELFSLGEGNYSEADILEAARALTGWSVRDGESVFSPARFDRGTKTVLGETGPWGSGDVVRIALSQPACSRFLVRKLFAEFIAETVEPSDELIEPLADEFRIRNYDITWLLRTMLSSWAFFDQGAIRQRVKSPVEFIVSIIRGLGAQANANTLAEASERLGQTLFYPPSVKGWDGGTDWINSTTLLARQNLAFDLTKGSGIGNRSDPGRLPMLPGLDTDIEMAEFFVTIFHQREEPELVAEIAQYLAEERAEREAVFASDRAIRAHLARTAAHLALTAPEFQLG